MLNWAYASLKNTNSLVEYKFCHSREVSVTQSVVETIVAPVGKSDLAFDLQTDIIFGGNGKGKINKFIDSVVIGRNLRINKPHVCTCREDILCFALIYCQPDLNRLPFDSTKGYFTYISLAAPYDVTSVRKQLDTSLKNLGFAMPSRLSL